MVVAAGLILVQDIGLRPPVDGGAAKRIEGHAAIGLGDRIGQTILPCDPITASTPWHSGSGWRFEQTLPPLAAVATASTGLWTISMFWISDRCRIRHAGNKSSGSSS